MDTASLGVTVGANVLRRRRLAEMDQTVLARTAGIDRAHLWRIETGRCQNLELDTVAALAAALGCRVDDLLDARAESAA